MAQFSGAKVIVHTACILIFCTTFVGKFSHSKENVVRYYHNCICLNVKYLLFLSYFNETWIFLAAFGKFWSIRFHENQSCGSPIVLCGWTEDNFFFCEMNSQRRIWEKFWMKVVVTSWLLKLALEIVCTPLWSKFYFFFWTTAKSVIPLLLIMSDSSMINKNTSVKPILGLD